jgi:hypothetical protein
VVAVPYFLTAKRSRFADNDSGLQISRPSGGFFHSVEAA